MKCDHLKEAISAYIDDELNFIARWRLNRHLKKCGECQKEFEELKKLHTISKAFLRLPSEVNVYEKIRKRVPQKNFSPQKEPGVVKKAWVFLPQPGKLALAAAVGLLIFLSLVYPHFFSSSSVSVEQFEREYLRSQETLSWTEEPVLSATLVGER